MTGPLLGREPVVTVSTVTAMLIAVLPVFGWPADVVGVVSGALVVIAGAVSAALVSVDRVLPLLVGVGKAVLAVAAAFGLHLPSNWVAGLMALLTVIAGLQVRQQVVPEQAPQWKGRAGQFAVGEVEHLAPRHLQDAPPPPDDSTQQFDALPRQLDDGVFDYDAPDMPPSALVEDPPGYRVAQHYEQDRGGEGRHAQRGWVAGRLDPSPGV